MIGEYCRAIERHLCQKNEGHLIRIVGPAFELVAGWEGDGVPLKVALRGIDRYFERCQRTRKRRRPVRIEFCASDVQDVFDEWRRALGLSRIGLPAVASPSGDAHGDDVEARSHMVSVAGAEAGASVEAEDDEPRERRGPSLRAHLERAAVRLSSARATGRIDARADAVLERLSGELDLASARATRLRGDARQALLDRLVALDRELADAALASLDAAERTSIESEARHELHPFRARMAPDHYDRSLRMAIDRLVRERTGLPVLAFSS